MFFEALSCNLHDSLMFINKYMYKTSQPPIDSFYYLAVDNTGNKSIIHDSGIRPSKTQPGSVITLQILKRDDQKS